MTSNLLVKGQERLAQNKKRVNPSPFSALAKLAGEFAATVLLCQLSYMLREGTWQDSNLRPKEPLPSPPANLRVCH